MASTTPRPRALSVAPSLTLALLLGLTACQGNSTPQPATESTVAASAAATPATGGASASSAAPATATAAAPARGTMNLTQIAAGDYSSIAGTWKNGQGQTVTIDGDVAHVDAGTGPYTTKLSDPVLYADPPVAYVKLPDSGVTDSPPQLILVPAGSVPAQPCDTGPTASCRKDLSDTSVDRLLVVGNGGTDVLGDPTGLPLVFYRAD